MKLTEIISVIPFYKSTLALDNIEINTIEMDSRMVNQGNLFVCINGFTVDGHEFAQQAVERGAVAIVAEREVEASVPIIIVPDTSRVLAMIAAKFYHDPTSEFPLIGVTGTNGKTTVTYLLEAIFNQFQKKTGVIGTIHLKIGDDAFPVKNTTPDALFLQQTFKKMVDQEVDRKSTRLNSSHVAISYAVFCLK